MSPLPSGPDIFLDIFDEAPSQDLAAGDVLINAGAKADQVFNILNGMLMVSRTGGDGRRQVLSFLVRDNFVGLTATDRYFFTIEAVTPTRVACLPRRMLTERLAADPEAPDLQQAVRALRDKYPQYGEVPVLRDPPTLLVIQPDSIRSWCAREDAISHALDSVR